MIAFGVDACLHRLTIAGIIAILAAATTCKAQDPASSQPAQAPTTQPTTAPAATTAQTLPDVSPEDLAILIKASRKAMRDVLLDRGESAASYRPLSLKGLQAIVHLVARRDGVELADAESAEMDAVDASVAAGVKLGRAIKARKTIVTQKDIQSGGDKLSLEFEWIGPDEPVAAKYGAEQRWSPELLRSFDAGREGVGVRLFDQVGRVRPGQILASNYTPDLALTVAETSIGLTHSEKVIHEADVHYFRFGTHHVWQESARSIPIVLTRGAETVAPEAVDAKEIDAAIERIGHYLRYRQNDDGWFSYEYMPSMDRYAERDSAAAQAHALMGLARFAAWTGRTEDREAARRGLDAAVARLRPVWIPPTQAGAASQPTSAPEGQPTLHGLVLNYPGLEHLLESSARVAIALQWGSGLVDRKSECSAVVKGLVHAQDTTGAIEMLPAATKGEAPEDYRSAGWALTALAICGDGLDGPTFDGVFHRAYAYYRPRLVVSKATSQSDVDLAGPLAALALARGFAAGYARTHDARQSDTVFRVLDALCERQMTEANCAALELRGALAVRGGGDFGAETAYGLSALIDGARLAERVGDAARKQRYADTARRAARFVMQLEIRPSGGFYMRSGRDTLGGIRTKPWDNRIRVDHCAEALLALMDAREFLFGPREVGATTSQPTGR